MEKTITITIGRAVFLIEENAYDRLDKYLETLREHFASYADSREIMADIESRIAEKFSEKIKNAGRPSIVPADVEEVIAAMGEAKDLSGESKSESQEEKAAEEKTEKEAPRRLFRNPDDQIVAGVASGLAAYFGIDPVIVRLAFVLLTIFGSGSGILAYVILWIVIPKAKTASEKLEMRGKPVTVEKIEKSIKETLEKSRINKTSLRRFTDKTADVLRNIFSAFGRVIEKIFPLFGLIFGIIFIIVGVAAIFSVCFAASVAIFSLNTSFLSVPCLQGIAGTAPFIVFVIAASLIVVILHLFILFLGITMVRRKNSFNGPLTFLLLALWMAAIITVGVIGVSFAPEIMSKIDEVRTVAVIEGTRDFQVGNFDRISVDGIDQIVVKQGDNYSVSAEGASADLESLKIQVKGDELVIGRNDDIFRHWNNPRAARINIVLPALNNLRLDGLASAQVGPLKQAELSIDIDGLAKASVETELADRLEVKMDGLSELNMKGSVRDSQVNVDGSAKYNAKELVSVFGDFFFNGMSRGEITVTDKAKITALGISSCRYGGGASIDSKLDDAAKIEAY